MNPLTKLVLTEKNININKRLQILQPLLAPVTPYSHKSLLSMQKRKELLVGQEKLQSAQT